MSTAPTDDGPVTGHHADDASHLQALGYESEFKREMSPWANFSLGFTYLSPVVGVYTLFAFALATGGPPMIFSFLIVGLGQLLVALIFSEVVAQFPGIPSLDHECGDRAVELAPALEGGPFHRGVAAQAQQQRHVGQPFDEHVHRPVEHVLQAGGG